VNIEMAMSMKMKRNIMLQMGMRWFWFAGHPDDQIKAPGAERTAAGRCFGSLLVGWSRDDWMQGRIRAIRKKNKKYWMEEMTYLPDWSVTTVHGVYRRYRVDRRTGVFWENYRRVPTKVQYTPEKMADRSQAQRTPKNLTLNYIVHSRKATHYIRKIEKCEQRRNDLSVILIAFGRVLRRTKALKKVVFETIFLLDGLLNFWFSFDNTVTERGILCRLMICPWSVAILPDQLRAW
jgi:hypothetical protein